MLNLSRRIIPKLVIRSQTIIGGKPIDPMDLRGEKISIKEKIFKQIKLAGPMSIATYMHQCNMGEDKAGYYMSRDPLGADGDFVTSPEISQLFGEMIGTWCFHEFLVDSRSEKLETALHIIELGPGRATMMSDILRISRYLAKYLNNNSDDSHRKIKISMVEVSTSLKQKQQETLNKYIDPISHPETFIPGLEIEWYETLDAVPLDEDVPEYILAHEFYDALPIYKFKKVAAAEKVSDSENLVGQPRQLTNELREILIDIDPVNESKLRYVLAPNKTPASHMAEQIANEDPTSLISRGFEEYEQSFQGGAIFVIAAERIAKTGGNGLVIDYGYTQHFTPENNIKEIVDSRKNDSSDEKEYDDGKIIDTFRGYQKHKMVDVLEDQGNVDLTADVDFDLLAKSLLYSDFLYENVRLGGPITQREFLKNMGIDNRLKNLLKENKDSKIREKILRGYEYITDNEKMGQRFKVMAIVNRTRAEYLEVPLTGFVGNNTTHQ